MPFAKLVRDILPGLRHISFVGWVETQLSFLMLGHDPAYKRCAYDAVNANVMAYSEYLHYIILLDARDIYDDRLV